MDKIVLQVYVETFLIVSYNVFDYETNYCTNAETTKQGKQTKHIDFPSQKKLTRVFIAIAIARDPTYSIPTYTRPTYSRPTYCRPAGTAVSSQAKRCQMYSQSGSLQQSGYRGVMLYTRKREGMSLSRHHTPLLGPSFEGPHTIVYNYIIV